MKNTTKHQKNFVHFENHGSLVELVMKCNYFVEKIAITIKHTDQIIASFHLHQRNTN